MGDALKQYDLDIDIYDPCDSPEEVQHEYGLAPVQTLEKGKYDAVVLVVAHSEFKAMSNSK